MQARLCQPFRSLSATVQRPEPGVASTSRRPTKPYALSLRLLPWLFLLGAAPGLAGVIYTVDITDHKTSEPTTHQQRMKAEGKMIEVDVSGRGQLDGRVIFRGEEQRVFVIDDADKSYSVVDREMLAGISAQVDSALEQARKALENVPAEQRAMLQEVLDQNMPQGSRETPEVRLERTETTGTHLDHPTRRFLVYVDGVKRHELWITPWKYLDHGEGVEDAFLELSTFFRDMLDGVTEMTGGQAPQVAGTQGHFFDYLDRLDGFPVISRSFGDDGELTEESVLRSAKRHVLEPDAFEPPAGYKRRHIFQQ